MSFLTNLAEDQEMTIQIQDHSGSSWILFRLSLLLLLWYSSKGTKQPSSQSKIVPFGLESLKMSRRPIGKVVSMVGFQGIVRPELDVWHPINGRRWAKREESGSCQLAMGGTSNSTSTTTSTTITIKTPLSDRPPPSVSAWPIDGGNGGDMQLIR